MLLGTNKHTRRQLPSRGCLLGLGGPFQLGNMIHRLQESQVGWGVVKGVQLPGLARDAGSFLVQWVPAALVLLLSLPLLLLLGQQFLAGCQYRLLHQEAVARVVGHVYVEHSRIGLPIFQCNLRNTCSSACTSTGCAGRGTTSGTRVREDRTLTKA